MAFSNTLLAAVCLTAVFALSFAQFYESFGGYTPLASAVRDSRQNRGPVVFPTSQIGSETSGVRVGASGYGFVPPGAGGRAVGGHGPFPGFQW